MNINYKRESGILMHITSLPSRFGIGDVGEGAYSFANKLAKAGFSWWQILPLSPTGYGNSPYSPRSTFAYNEYLLSLEKLKESGYLDEEDLERAPSFNDRKVDFNKVINFKGPLLKKAAISFLNRDGNTKEFKDFIESESFWLKDYALFMVLYEKYGTAEWEKWDEKDKRRDSERLREVEEENIESINIYYALQFLFAKEWRELKSYVNSLGIKIVGDIPIFVGRDSADAWSNTALFKTDENLVFNKVSGVPPDNFSADGQLWGNPVYDWSYHEKTNFSWWKKRIKNTLKTVDVLRIDHFRGFDAYYEIDAKAKDAKNGVWIKSPGRELFKALKEELGEISIIAEDLGIMTESVEELRDSNHFPGMKIAHDGFIDYDGDINGKDNFLPHNYTRQFVAYAGTHDNNTTKGWFESLKENEKRYVLEYLDCSKEDVPWALMKAVMKSNADYAVLTMQDILNLGKDARMNFPSTCNDDNWSWRMREDEFSDTLINKLKRLNKMCGRGL